MLDFLKEEQIDPQLIHGIASFRASYALPPEIGRASCRERV